MKSWSKRSIPILMTLAVFGSGAPRASPQVGEPYVGAPVTPYKGSRRIRENLKPADPGSV